MPNQKHARVNGWLRRAMHSQNISISPAVLVIGGSDSSGGAGVTRDLLTLNHFNIITLCAITAVTAQTDSQVTGIHHVVALTVRQQIAAALASRRIDAIKIGMLGTAATVAAVIDSLPETLAIPIVLDPVLMSSSGSRLLDAAGIALLKQQLLPRCSLLTPNLLEAATLLQTSVALNENEMIEQAYQLLQLGPHAVLLKGGHATNDHALDVLLTRDQPPLRLHAARINASLRGTGCALASAIAGLLAAGLPLHQACRQGKHFVLKALLNARGQHHHELHDNIEQPAL